MTGLPDTPLQAEGDTRAPMAGFVDSFRRAIELRASPRYAQKNVSYVRRFLWHCGASAPVHVTAAAAQEFLAEQQRGGAAPRTLRSIRTAISQFAEHLILHGQLQENKVLSVQIPRPEERIPTWLSESETREILVTAERQGCWGEVALALGTGLRVGELVRLRWQDVDEGTRRLLVRKSKSHRTRTVPLGHLAMEALRRQRPLTGTVGYVFAGRERVDGHHWSYVEKPRGRQWWDRTGQMFQREMPKFAQAGKRCGRAWHMFRHTFASRLAQGGPGRPAVSIYKIAAWLGHRSVDFTARTYAHLAEQYDEDIESAGFKP